MKEIKKHPKGGWYCPTCQEWTIKLTYSRDKVFCPRCYCRPVKTGENLHQDVGDGETRVTLGKAREIEARMVCPDDGRTVINRYTGRETQR